MTVARRIVEICDAAGSDASENVRIIRLPDLIVTSANYGIGECVQDPRSNRPASLVKVARILSEKRWQDSASNQRAGESVSVGCAEALCVSACALAISRK